MPAGPPIRVGLVGLDTSHVMALSGLLNDPARPDHVPGARVVAGWKGGSPDVESSAKRVDKFTADLAAKWKVEIVPTIEELLRKVDAVIITSVDGRTHLPQARKVFGAGKPVFIDKPFAAGVEDAKAIARLARETKTPFFSSSGLRFMPDVEALRSDAAVGKVQGAITWGPSPTEPHHPDLFWYGIHAVELLYGLLGPGCLSVSRTSTASADVAVGRWADGRVGIVRGARDGAKGYGAVVFGKEAGAPRAIKFEYRPLAAQIVAFFQTRKPPVAPDETLEIMAFMQAADASKGRGGADVPLADLLK